MKLIRFKFLASGFLVVALSLIIVGAVGCNIVTQEQMNKSQEYAALQAAKIATTIEVALDAVIKTASAHATDMDIRITSEKVNELGRENAQAEIAELREQLQNKLALLDKKYLGILITDSMGYLYSGVVASGSEYKGANLADMDYFKETKNSRKAAIGNAALSRVANDRVYVVSAPIYSRNNEFLGIIGLLLKAESLNSLVSTVRVGQTGYAFMADSNGIIIAHPRKEFEMTLDLKTLKDMSAVTQAMTTRKKGALKYIYKGVPKITGFAPVSTDGWSVAFTQIEDELLHIIRDTK